MGYGLFLRRRRLAAALPIGKQWVIRESGVWIVPYTATYSIELFGGGGEGGRGGDSSDGGHGGGGGGGGGASRLTKKLYSFRSGTQYTLTVGEGGTGGKGVDGGTTSFGDLWSVAGGKSGESGGYGSEGSGGRGGAGGKGVGGPAGNSGGDGNSSSGGYGGIGGSNKVDGFPIHSPGSGGDGGGGGDPYGGIGADGSDGENGAVIITLVSAERLASVTVTGGSTSCYVTYGGETYQSGAFGVSRGDTITIYGKRAYKTTIIVSVDGTQVASGTNQVVTYDYTVTKDAAVTITTTTSGTGMNKTTTITAEITTA